MCLGLFFQKWKIGYHIIKTKYASWYFLYPISSCVCFNLYQLPLCFSLPFFLFFFLSSVYCYVVRRIPAGISIDPWPTICLPVIPYPNLPYPEILECNFFLSFSGFFLNTLFNSLILILCEEIIRIVVF